MVRKMTAFAFAAVLVHAPILLAQIAVSANDGKQKGAEANGDPLTADDITILDLTGPVKVLATLPAPTSMIGPPASVALARDSSFAIVTAAQSLDAAGALVPADIVTVIDIRSPSKPKIAQTLHAGAGASGVAINPAGTLALVTNVIADSISVFVIAGRRLTARGTVALPPKSKPYDIAFADGQTAYVVIQGANALSRLKVDGQKVTPTAQIEVGVQPYSMALDVKRKIAYVTNLGGRDASTLVGPKMGTIAIVDLNAGRMVGQVDVGVTPEHVSLSPSGSYIQATLINGSNAASNSSNHHDHGSVSIMRINGKALEPVTEVESGAWCQGATWSDDEKRLLLQCAGRRQIEVYKFDGKTLIADANQTVQLDARGGAIATARSR